MRLSAAGACVVLLAAGCSAAREFPLQCLRRLRPLREAPPPRRPPFMPGNNEQWGRDVRAWFPPPIADHIMAGTAHLDEADLLARARALLANGQLPVATSPP